MKFLLEFDLNEKNLVGTVYDILVEGNKISIDELEKFLKENKMGIFGDKKEKIYEAIVENYGEAEDPGIATVKYELDTFKLGKVPMDLLGLTEEENAKLVEYVNSIKK